MMTSGHATPSMSRDRSSTGSTALRSTCSSTTRTARIGGFRCWQETWSTLRSRRCSSNRGSTICARLVILRRSSSRTPIPESSWHSRVETAASPRDRLCRHLERREAPSSRARHGERRVSAIERARARSARRAPSAVELWETLVGGRASLVERTERIEAALPRHRQRSGATAVPRAVARGARRRLVCSARPLCEGDRLRARGLGARRIAASRERCP